MVGGSDRRSIGHGPERAGRKPVGPDRGRAGGTRTGSVLVVLSLLGAAPGARAANRAISCDGVDDFAIASFSPLVSTSTFTVEVWARPDAFSSFGSVASASDGYAVGAAGDARFTIGPGSTVTASGGSLTLGEWVHLAGTYDGTTVRVFVDGQPVGSEIKPDMAVVSLTNFKFCVWPNGGAFFQGAVDEMRIWDHVRTDEEIASAHAESLPGDEPGLLAYYRFDGPGEQTIVDSSPNGRNGTLGADASVASDDPTRTEPGAPVPEAAGASLVALLTLAGLSQGRRGRRRRSHAVSSRFRQQSLAKRNPASAGWPAREGSNR